MTEKASVLSFGVITLVLGPVTLFALEPTTRPGVPTAEFSMQSAPPLSAEQQDSALSPDSTDEPGASTSVSTSDTRVPHHQPREGMLGRARFAQRLLGPVSQKEVADAMIYLKEHSPNRAAAIQSLPEGDRKNRVVDVAARNYLNWMHILNQDPELYKIIKQRIEVEDNIFGLVSKFKKDSPETQDSTRSQLHEQVSMLVDLGIEERQIRLQKLQQTVKDLTAKLETDSSHRSELVDQRLKMILSDGKNSSSSSSSAAGGRDGGNVRPGETHLRPVDSSQ